MSTRWAERLARLTQTHGVPGASLAVLHNGEIAEMAAGVLNVETGITATTDSVFQLGSISKVLTSTLVMQLVAAGEVRLDDPVVSILPELRLADADQASLVTLEHLLTHTSGIEGDHFEDTGRGDDALERYVESCETLGFVHPVGATMSYCNTGLVIAGRIVERLTGQTWDAALRERLLEPLGLRRTVTLPEEALRFRTAYGHIEGGNGAPRLTREWSYGRSMGPAGLVCASAADTVAFARMHLDAGAGLLPAGSVTAMQEARVELPDPWTLGSHWGLGWILFDWDGRRIFGHDGATFGQAAFLRVVPDAGVAVALLTNGGHAEDLYRELLAELLRELCALEMPAPLAPSPHPPQVDASRHAGAYERVGVRLELEYRDGSLTGRRIATGSAAALEDEPVRDLSLVPIDDRVFVTRFGGERTWTPVVFYDVPGGGRYLHMGARATPKIS